MRARKIRAVCRCGRRRQTINGLCRECHKDSALSGREWAEALGERVAKLKATLEAKFEQENLEATVGLKPGEPLPPIVGERAILAMMRGEW